MTFPVFVHYGIELWVPEVGGRVDPGSDAHDLVMSLYGGMSKGERNRIKIRVRSAMAAQAQGEGRFLGGRPPYGYVLAPAGPHPNPQKANLGQRVHRLEVDPSAAPIVARIFDEYLSGRGLYAIAEGLTSAGIPSPSAHDPARNRHRIASGGAWSKSAVRVILGNPRYMGRMVWNRQRRDEILRDVDDVADGYDTRMRWNDRSEWIWSADVSHEPLISPETFDRAQSIMRSGARRPVVKRRATARRYVLSGLVVCGICGRRMAGNYNHGAAHYRCRFPAEYALANRIDHPRTVYVKEAAILPPLDEWLASCFAPRNLEATLDALASVGAVDEAQDARAEAARRKIEDCDGLLAKYRATLEAGGDPVVIAGWMQEVQGDRLRAERDLARSAPSEPVGKAELRALVGGVRDAVKMLHKADPALKSEVYAGLGLRLEYRPETRVVAVEVPLESACATARVGGGT